MKGKIIVAGAGGGGLVAARILGQHGYEVKVFEKNRQGEVSYDWHDDVTPHVFTRLNIPLPEPEYYFKKRDWSFITPDGKNIIRIYQDAEKIDLSMERRPLIELLLARAAEHAEIYHEAVVEDLIVEDNRVRGMIVNGEKVFADLVIDSSGLNSILRERLPGSYRIQRHPRKEEVIYAYRAFYNRRPGSREPEHTNKAYLKHLGEEGISWCIFDPSGQVNVLVGRIGQLDDQTLQRGLKALREDNEIIGDRILRGGYSTAIPIRYPLSRMVGPGYVAVGDSAFMTIPMLGSGIATSMIAGHILAEVITAAVQSPLSVENLWHYQVRVMTDFGAENTGVDVLKRWLLSADNEGLSYLMGHNVVDADDMKKTAVGELVDLSLPDMLRKLAVGYRKMGLLLQLNQVLSKARKARKMALNIPPTYNEVKIDTWQENFDRMLNS
ncbi:MAG: NAD(P)/FAD-dependent oxidoreductase [Firmicutes bacterium]|jgi:flavin-dependent dehydrogenase|nr:NAD(P)/FAD-dependent oxidoreductase [Bacillota bacterium]